MKIECILVIDDDFISSYLLNATLTSLNVAEKIVVKSDAVQALDFLKLYKANLIFVDLQMPAMDGFEFLEQFSTEEIFKKIRIIALTSYLRERDKIKLNSLGVHEYLEKPLTDQKIKEVLFLK